MIMRWRALALALALVFCGVGPALAADINTPPIARLIGDQTKLTSPGSVALDNSGRRYVLQGGSILIFGSTANGNVAPERTITGSNTELDITSRTVEVAPNGRIYVTEGINNQWKILIFAATASGNEAPVARLEGDATGLSWPTGMAFDAQGGLYIANRAANSILWFAPGITGNSSPSRVIRGESTWLDNPTDVALDSTGGIHVANQNGESITSYAPNTGGDAAPVRRLAGPSTGLSASPTAGEACCTQGWETR